jgi:pimeloyl-ACP methyl ester carboxylesterase
VWHFPFHCLPDLPEQLIAGREREYLTWFLRRKCANPTSITDAALDEYVRCITQPGGLRAGLAYYRSAALLSAQQNRTLLSKGKLKVPLLAVSSDEGSIPDMAAPLEQHFDNVRGIRITHCGHFIPEEQPQVLAQELLDFFIN